MIQHVWQDAYHQILIKAILVEWFGEEEEKKKPNGERMRSEKVQAMNIDFKQF